MKRSIGVFLGSAILGATLASPMVGMATSSGIDMVDVSGLELTNAQARPRIDRSQFPISGSVEIVVQLSDPPLALANGEDSRRIGGVLNRGQQIAHSATVRQRQSDLLMKIIALGGTEIGRVRIAYNAAIVRVDASKLTEIAALPGVVTVRRVGEYRLSLSDTVPYIGATVAHAVALDGFGVKVAVLDSGVDYTHLNLGGPGTLAAYAAAYGVDPSDPKNTTRDGLFPTAKVIEGFDFVGEQWPICPPNVDCRSEDPDPIDFSGHGTHVADIIGGKSLDGLHVGVAPAVSLLAVRVCSAVTTSCSGVALLKAMDFALDPNGDGCMDDAVDVINMSLGSDYGQKQDDLSFASTNAVRAGVVVVAAAGNAADRPYILGSPSSTPEVISVAQTQVPSAAAIPLVVNSPANIAGQYTNTATLAFAPVGSGATGNVAFVGRGCPAESIEPGSPEDPYLDNPAGKIALIDRGACAVSLKIDRAAQAGAIGVLLGLVAAGDAITFSFGGGTMFVPSLVITQSTANLIKANIAAPVNASMSEAVNVPLVGSMVGSSSRGPSYSFSAIKPDIGAPGASVSAVVGTGTGEEAFGGTSGATPVISGSTAILIQKYPNRSPKAIKSLLMNTADTQIYTNPAVQPGVLAPITRIGGGEVRVDQALASTTAAWDSKERTGSLSFGYFASSDPATLKRRVRVRNYSTFARTYSIVPSFRFANDEANGAVSLQTPSAITVPGRDNAEFDVWLTIDPSKLPTWNLNGGSQGGNGPLLQGVEFDGYISIADDRDDIHLAWQVLPHKAAEDRAVHEHVTLIGDDVGLLTVKNTSNVLAGRLDVFSLTGTSPRVPRRDLPQAGDNFAIVDLAAVGVRAVNFGGGQFGLQFGINTFGQRTHPNYPAEFDIYVDSNDDGEFDFVVFNSENVGFGATGQNVVSVFSFAAGTVVTRFFNDADLNSANVIMTALLSDLGLTLSTRFTFSVFAFDNYFTGNLTDSIEDMTYTLDTPRFFATGVPVSGVPADGSSVLSVDDIAAGDTASPSQTGLLLLYRDAHKNREADTISVKTKPKKN